MNARSFSRQASYAACTLTILLFSAVAHAQSLGLDVGAGGARTSIDSFGSGTYGWTFTVGAAPVTVTALGAWDYMSQSLVSNPAVGLWDSAGNLLASTTVTNSSTMVASNGPYGSWLFNSVTATTLAAGQTYTLGAYELKVTGQPSQPLLYDVSTVTTDSRIVYSSAVTDYASGGQGGASLADPTVVRSGFSQGVFGPNVQFSAGGTASAPEPGSLVLLASLAVPAGGIVIRRRRQTR